MSGLYRTIVADPPWPMPESGARSPAPTDTHGVYRAKSGVMVDGACWSRQSGRRVELPYQTMTVDEIQALPVVDLAERDAHLYLWTTNRFLEAAYQTARAWGFRPTQLLTWCKTPMGLGMGGAFATTTEFVIFARRGSLPHTARQDSTWWHWKRGAAGARRHSAKPEAFLDLVEQVSPGPYLELFSRRQRFGWDTWGDQSFGDVELDTGVS